MMYLLYCLWSISLLLLQWPVSSIDCHHCDHVDTRRWCLEDGGGVLTTTWSGSYQWPGTTDTNQPHRTDFYTPTSWSHQPWGGPHKEQTWWLGEWVILPIPYGLVNPKLKSCSFWRPPDKAWRHERHPLMTIIWMPPTFHYKIPDKQYITDQKSYD